MVTGERGSAGGLASQSLVPPCMSVTRKVMAPVSGSAIGGPLLGVNAYEAAPDEGPRSRTCRCRLLGHPFAVT
jgi:hypothetical protein